MSDKAKLIVRFGLIAVGVILLIIFINKGLTYHNEYVEKSGTYDLKLADLQKELLVVKAQVDQETLDVAATESNVHDLNDVGLAVATIQNDLVRNLNKYGIVQYNQLSSLDSNVQSCLQRLDEYFDGEDVRPWYQWAPKSGWTPQWVCDTNYAFYGNTMTTWWSCYNMGEKKNGALLAVASAVYHADTNSFTDLVVYVTETGMKTMATVEEEEGGQ